MIVPIYAKVSIKCQAQYYQLLTKVLNDIKAFKPRAVAGALRQTDYKTNYKYQNTRHWH
jgi:hypothetical protein